MYLNPYIKYRLTFRTCVDEIQYNLKVSASYPVTVINDYHICTLINFTMPESKYRYSFKLFVISNLYQN